MGLKFVAWSSTVQTDRRGVRWRGPPARRGVSPFMWPFLRGWAVVLVSFGAYRGFGDYGRAPSVPPGRRLARVFGPKTAGAHGAFSSRRTVARPCIPACGTSPWPPGCFIRCFQSLDEILVFLATHRSSSRPTAHATGLQRTASTVRRVGLVDLNREVIPVGLLLRRSVLDTSMASLPDTGSSDPRDRRQTDPWRFGSSLLPSLASPP